jgi:hypothetical protein
LYEETLAMVKKLTSMRKQWMCFWLTSTNIDQVVEFPARMEEDELWSYVSKA